MISLQVISLYRCHHVKFNDMAAMQDAHLVLMLILRDTTCLSNDLLSRPFAVLRESIQCPTRCSFTPQGLHRKPTSGIYLPSLSGLSGNWTLLSGQSLCYDTTLVNKRMLYSYLISKASETRKFRRKGRVKLAFNWIADVRNLQEISNNVSDACL